MSKVKMTTYRAIMIAEGEKNSSKSEWLQAWQYLIDTEICWSLQGWYGRQAQRLLENGECKYPEKK